MGTAPPMPELLFDLKKNFCKMDEFNKAIFYKGEFIMCTVGSLFTCIACGKQSSFDQANRVDCFKHGGLVITFNSDVGVCVNCRRKEYIGLYNKFVGKIVDIDEEEEKIIVNWAKFDSDNAGICRFLRAIGVLSFMQKGNWEIVAEGPISLNPRSSTFVLYFTSLTDAEEYASHKFSETQYDWHIQKVDTIMSKREVLKK